MTGLSNEEIWLFIILFTGIILLYSRNAWKTVRFVIKDKPKDAEKKWKVRFPIIDHMKWTQEEKKIVICLGILFLVIIGFRWIETGDNQFFSLFMVTFVFACLMITREFGITYFIKGDELTVWSVHNKPYKTRDGKDLLYQTKIKRDEIESIKEQSQMIILYLKENKLVYIKGNKKERDEMKKWLKLKK